MFGQSREMSCSRSLRAAKSEAHTGWRGHSATQRNLSIGKAYNSYQKSHALRLTLEEQTATYAETARLANDRYRGGSTSFLEVLTTQQQYFTSQLQSSQAWFAELQNYVQLYQALGGGWQH